MHGLINWSIEKFVCETYGQTEWQEIAIRARLKCPGFEPLMTYEDQVTFDVLAAASARLKKPQDAILVDLGIFLVSHPKLEVVRRLLRFGGDTFGDFLYSLSDLADRVHLALPGLEMPEIELHLNAPGIVTLRCTSAHSRFGHVMVGILQAMADDYGTLALFEHLGHDQGAEFISVQMLSETHAQGRNFSLGAGAG